MPGQRARARAAPPRGQARAKPAPEQEHVAQTRRKSLPEPARRLRAELQHQRDRGTPFGSAWRIATTAALGGLELGEVVEWRRTFAWARSHFHAAYSGFSRPRPGLFVADDDAA